MVWKTVFSCSNRQTSCAVALILSVPPLLTELAPCIRKTRRVSGRGLVICFWKVSRSKDLIHICIVWSWISCDVMCVYLLAKLVFREQTDTNPICWDFKLESNCKPESEHWSWWCEVSTYMCYVKLQARTFQTHTLDINKFLYSWSTFLIT